MIKKIVFVFKNYTLKEILLRIPEKIWFITIQRHVNNRIFKKNLKAGIFAVDINNNISGIGARLQYALEIFAYCEKHKLIPQIKFTYKNDKRDFFNEFFEFKLIPDVNLPFKYMKIRTIAEIDLGWQKLDLEQSRYLVHKYLKPRQHIVDEVDIFFNKNFLTEKVLGIHYRGTDKYKEAALVSYEKVLEFIEFHLIHFPGFTKIFISSDEENFIAFIAESRLKLPVIYRRDSIRSKNLKGVHFSKTCKYEMNRDAIINCLLLSRCDTLLKTVSTLSVWSTYFNPELPVVICNKPHHKWLPENELIKHALYSRL